MTVGEAEFGAYRRQRFNNNNVSYAFHEASY